MNTKTGNTILVALAMASFVAACSNDYLNESAINLRQSMGANVEPVAVTTTPDGLTTFVLDVQTGIYSVKESGDVHLVLAIEDFPDPGVEIRPPFTDLVALDKNRLAITAVGDGFLLDLDKGTMELYFCYEPGFDGGPGEPQPSIWQRTDAATYWPLEDKIIAQPRTYDEFENHLRSDIGFYNRETGVDEAWMTLPEETLAGGMIIDDKGQIHLGVDHKILRPLENGNVQEIVDLTYLGIKRIDGMTYSGTKLLILDGERDRLHIVDAEILNAESVEK